MSCRAWPQCTSISDQTHAKKEFGYGMRFTAALILVFLLYLSNFNSTCLEFLWELVNEFTRIKNHMKFACTFQQICLNESEFLRFAVPLLDLVGEFIGVSVLVSCFVHVCMYHSPAQITILSLVQHLSPRFALLFPHSIHMIWKLEEERIISYFVS